MGGGRAGVRTNQARSGHSVGHGAGGAPASPTDSLSRSQVAPGLGPRGQARPQSTPTAAGAEGRGEPPTLRRPEGVFPSYWEGRCSHSLPVGILSLGTSENRYIHAAVTRDTFVGHSNDTSSKGMNGLPGLGRRPGVHTAECLQGLGIHISTQRGENGGSRRLQEVAGLSGGERRLASNQTRSALRLHKGSLCPSLGERLMGGGSPRSGRADRGAVASEEADVPRPLAAQPPGPSGQSQGAVAGAALCGGSNRPAQAGAPRASPLLLLCPAHSPPTFRSPAPTMPVPARAFRAQARLQSCRGPATGATSTPRGLSSASTSAHGRAARKTGTAWETPTDHSVHHLLPRGRFLECGLHGRP